VYTKTTAGAPRAHNPRAMQDQTGGNLRGGARRFSALTSGALRAPSVSAERKAKPDRSSAIKTGHFKVLPNRIGKQRRKTGSGGGTRTHGLGIMRPSLYLWATPPLS